MSCAGCGKLFSNFRIKSLHVKKKIVLLQSDFENYPKGEGIKFFERLK